MASRSNRAQSELGLTGGKTKVEINFMSDLYNYIAPVHAADLTGSRHEPEIFHNVHSNIYRFIYNVEGDKRLPGMFSMIRHQELERISLRIRHGGKDVGMALLLWNLCMANAEFDTAWVKLDRQELADKAGTTPSHVSTVMKLLHDYGAVFTYRVKGRPRYRCNPAVGHAGYKVSDLQKQVVALENGIKQMAEDLRNAPQLPV